MQSPFDKHSGSYNTHLMCSGCGCVFWGIGYEGEYPIHWPERETDIRILNLIDHRIKKHKCESPADDEIKFLAPRKAPEEIPGMPKFRIGSHVVNIASGHIWKLLTDSDVETLVEGFKNGKRNIRLYIGKR